MEFAGRLKPMRLALAFLLIALFSCNGKKKTEQEGKTPPATEQGDAEKGPRYVKSVQFVYPMKYDTCRYGEETTVSFANNRRYVVDSAHVFFNQRLIAALEPLGLPVVPDVDTKHRPRVLVFNYDLLPVHRFSRAEAFSEAY